MTTTPPLDPIAAFITEHPWPTVALVFLIGVALPAIWSTHCWRRRAAMAVIRALVDTCTAVATIVTGRVDSSPQASSRGRHAYRSGNLTGTQPRSLAVDPGSCRVDQQRGEPLRPPVHAHVIDLDATLGQQLFDVPVRQPDPR